MNLEEYQRRAGETDQNAKAHDSTQVSQIAQNSDVIPLLGLVGEVGALLGEYKKLLRDGATHRKFGDEVKEELGDILWYVANVATKFKLSLDDIAEQNLSKVKDRWSPPEGARHLYDEQQLENQRLPKRFEYSFEYRSIDGARKVVMVDRLNGDSIETTGDPLTDNAYDDDGYRFHDAVHLAFAACLGWSPVLRKLLRNKKILVNRDPKELAEVEDGGRARVVEEGIAFAAYMYAADHADLAGVGAVDSRLLRHIKQMTSRLEVKDRTTKEWNDAILRGFAVWRQLRDRDGGRVRGDLIAGTIEFIPPSH
ncbi:MAG: MazG nucleotide pyrophosphohydrolase domain-containing protein [Armatimonadota bacterium]|nr:MazG nucleotide pyrophosphohydrolase domain-containing protein [Armatimonadota bacterium]